MENNNKQNLEKKIGIVHACKSAQKNNIKFENKAANGNRAYQNVFLVNRFPSGRNGKVVYILPEYHERMQRVDQLAKGERMTLYAYIDNILGQHFKDHGDDISNYYNDKIKPIL